MKIVLLCAMKSIHHYQSCWDAYDELLWMLHHDDVIKWKHFPRYWPFVHKGQWCGALMFSMICVWINGWVNNCEAGDLRRYRVHYDVIVMVPISVTSWWARWRLKSPASQMFIQPFVQPKIKEDIKAPPHWPVTGEFPAQRASNTEHFSIWWRHHANVNKSSLSI